MAGVPMSLDVVDGEKSCSKAGEVSLDSLEPGVGVYRVFAKRLHLAFAIVGVPGVEAHDRIGFKSTTVMLDREHDTLATDLGRGKREALDVKPSQQRNFGLQLRL